jgi:putative ABC transport system permease protein
MDTLLQDIRCALRVLLRARGFATVAVLTFALGIGANTAVMGALRGVFLRPLPYPHPDRLIHVWATWPGGAGNFSFLDYRALLDEARALDAIAAYDLSSVGATSPPPTTTTPRWWRS